MHISNSSHHSDALKYSDLTDCLHRNGDDDKGKIMVNLVDKHTTLRWHMASKHKVS